MMQQVRKMEELKSEVNQMENSSHSVLRSLGDTMNYLNNLEEEFGDVLAWLSTLASLHGIDLEAVGRHKYRHGCPRCNATPCDCAH